MLIQDYSLLNEEESKYAANLNTHSDFLIYNRVSKQPVSYTHLDVYKRQILLTRNSCDPLNRRAVRVSMGSVFLIPWAWLDAVSYTHLSSN